MIRINKRRLSHFDLTGNILRCCFEVMKELGAGFLEVIYRNALQIVLKENGICAEVEQRFEVMFRGHTIGIYVVDLIVEDSVVIELKCCSTLLKEHQAQLINYLKVTDITVGLLVNFGNQKLEYKRLHHPEHSDDPIKTNPF